MGAVSSTLEAVSNVASGVGDIASGAIDGISQVGSNVDDFVNDQIPGGWATVAAITAATVGAPGLTGGETAAGSTATGSAGSMAAADAVYGGALAEPAGVGLLSPGLTATAVEAPVLASTAAPVAEGAFAGQGLTAGGGLGLQAPTLPGLEAMGGAQGLSIPAAGGGTLGAGGVGLAAGGLLSPVSDITGLPLGQEVSSIETGVMPGAGDIVQGGAGQNLAQRFLGNQLMATLFDNIASGISSPEGIKGLLGGAGSLIGSEQETEARQRIADLIRSSGQTAVSQASFRPVGITTRFGASQFQFNPQTGQLESAGYTTSPEFQALQNRLMGLAGTGLTQAEQAQAEFAPLTGAAQGLFGLGQQYLARSPQEVAQQYVERQQALLQPERERQLATIRNRLQRTGRTGLSVAQGGDLQAANPELAAYYNALAQQNLQLAAQGEQAGQQAAQFGAGLFGTGANILGQRYAGQQAALTPFTQYLTGVSDIEKLGQTPLSLSSDLARLSASAGGTAGQLGLRANIGAGEFLFPAYRYSPTSQVLSGLSSNPIATQIGSDALGRLFGLVGNDIYNPSYYEQAFSQVGGNDVFGLIAPM